MIGVSVGCLLPRAREARTRGRVIGLSVGCLFVCGHKNEQFERYRAVYELYLLRTSQKSKNISFYIATSRTRAYVSEPEKADVSIFFALLKLLFNIVDPCQKNDYYQSGRS